MVTAQEIMAKLNLKPLPQEGGYYHETYRSPLRLAPESLDNLYPGPRSVSTAIYYLITPETFSAMHRITGDEMFHFYLGDPVEMLQLHTDGSSETIRIGIDILGGMVPQVLVRGGVWQGLRLVDGGKFALMGTTVAPGFEFEDFEIGDRKTLSTQFPNHTEAIARFTY